MEHLPSEHPFAKSKSQSILKPWLLAGLIGLGILSLLVFYFYSSGKGEITILDTTPGLEISLNNHTVPAKNTNEGYVIPAFAGKYRLQIKKTNYLPFIQDIQLNRGEDLKIRPAYAFQPPSQKAATPGVAFVRPSADQKSIFYLGDNGRTIYRMEVANQVKVPLTDKPLYGVTDIQWSDTPNVALITKTDGIFLHEIPKFDFKNQTLVRLGNTGQIVSPVWHPLDPELIAFDYYPETGEKSLVMSDKRLTKLERKQDIRNLITPKLVWSPDGKYILLINRSSDYASNQIWIYNMVTGTYSQLTTRGNITNASFSPKSDTILYEDRSDNLFTIQADGSSDKALHLVGTIATATWKDDYSFFVPDKKSNTLNLYSTDGKRDSLSFSFPTTLDIQGTHYFPSNQTLIFYTDQSIYTVNLAL